MKYNKLNYKDKLQYQKCINIEENDFKDVFYATVDTPNGKKLVRINISCDCFKGGNGQLKKRKLCTHQVTALNKLLEENKNVEKNNQRRKNDFIYRI